jgi:WD40 repeat protein
MANSIAVTIHINQPVDWQRKTIDARPHCGYFGAVLLGTCNAKTAVADVKTFLCLFFVSAATAQFAQAQAVNTPSRPSEIRKPDFTISNAVANGGGAIAYAVDERLLAVAFNDAIQIYRIQARDPFEAKLIRTLTSDSPVHAMTLRDSNILVSLSADRNIKTWDTASGRILHRVSLDSGSFTVLTFASSDPPFLATGSFNRVTLWNYVSGELLSDLETTDSSISSLAFTPDGKLLVVGTQKGVVRVLDVATRKFTRTIDLDSPINALSASMRQIVLGYSDGTLAELGIQGQPSTHEISGHNDAVTALAFSPQGERFASGSASGTIKVWDAESLKLLGSLKGSTAAVLSITFAADGQVLVSSAANGIINGWHLAANR